MGISTISNFLNGETRGGPELIKKMSAVFKIPEEEIDRKQPPRERNVRMGEDVNYSPAEETVTSGGADATSQEMALGARKRALIIATEEMSDQELIAKITKTLHDQRLPREERYETAHVFTEVLWERTKKKKPGNGS
jgi:hypothetical protein